MNTLRVLRHRRRVTRVSICGVLILLALVAWPTHAQRPSIAELQDQINALQNPLDPSVAQVRTALDILPAFQEAVVRHYRATGSAPENRAAAGLTWSATDTSTNYITQVEIMDGTVTFTFGNYADPLIAGETLSFTPYETADQTIVWRCGAEPAPPATQLMGSWSWPEAVYIPPTIPPSTYPDPCILEMQSGSPDEVIRAQVLEAFDVVETVKDAVEIAGAAFGSPGAPIPPVDRAEAGLTADATDTSGNYFKSVDVQNGTIFVTYGNDANNFLYNEVLTFTPYETVDGTIVWRCGEAHRPGVDGIELELMGTMGAGGMAAYSPPTLLSRYLPEHCRQLSP